MAPERVIGLALKPAKCAKHINPTLLQKASEAGFVLRLLDPDLPLEAQGPLDAVLQKLRLPEWEEQLERYAEAHPHVKVFDRPSTTLPIRNRSTMLTMFEGGGWVFEGPEPDPFAEQQQQEQEQQRHQYHVCVPPNTMLAEGTSFAAAVQQLQAAGLTYPLLAKPMWADGREGSHALAVIANEVGLQRLVEGRAAQGFGLPVLMQQYVDHGGCLFKVYVLGGRAVMVKRNSLQLSLCSVNGSSKQHEDAAATVPSAISAAGVAGGTSQAACQQAASNCASPSSCVLVGDARSLIQVTATAARDSEPVQQAPFPSSTSSEDLETQRGLELVTRVSAYPRCRSWGNWDLAPKGHGVVSPPAWLVQELAQRLRRHLGLNLFNFDVIVPMPQPPPQQQPCKKNGRMSGSSPRQEPEQCAPQQQATSVYHVIDINYFPGYEKLPGYEDLMVQFLSSIWADENGHEA